ncbi:hypothetical protein Bealeia1_01351 [Candidatus Bealeia paramacronuclearis]|uniref:Uncharacterized protein n=1 Tax=Candidatus Bealeia paramacronuclearis TaxID=1921001 RepID=A0ABZ2C919_9PROT|nr:hypothetical protein [Candidatus Bealeia paramacronuclearis]
MSLLHRYPEFISGSFFEILKQIQNCDQFWKNRFGIFQ